MKRSCACVHPDARECIHLRTHPIQMDDAMDWPCRHCEDGDRCACSCHLDEDELSWGEEDSTRAGALCAAALTDTPEPEGDE
jgi:hypothetical protein